MQPVQDRGQDRRRRLVEAAATLVHRNGFNRTRLADVAELAEVPAGGVYYYFKTREALLDAILEERLAWLRERMREWDALPDPVARLQKLIQVWIDDKEVDAAYGCPVGSLCYELARRGGRLAERATEPLRLVRAWSERQFEALGKRRQAGELADHLVVVLQGASLVGNAFHDPELIAREARRLKRWVRSLA